MKRKLFKWFGGLAFAASLPHLASAQFAPYYGKNKVKYDKFNWQVYRSPHFEVYYYPEFEPQLGRIVSYAESAYERISNELKHEIPFAIPMILYKTFSEFQQTNLFPAEIPEGVLAFAEPARDRMVLPIDEPPDKLLDLITHELTHIFEFDIIPRSLVRQSVPLWIDEGLADYMTGKWDALDLMIVRDAAVTDQIPTFEELNVGFSRAPYDFGHAIFEFMEERFGKEGVRQFLFALRRAVVGGVSDDVYEQSFRMSPEEFDRLFRKWLKERFKPFRDKEIPTDYSLDLSPGPSRGRFIAALSAVPSPSRELVAVMSFNRRDGELDVVLLSAEDGKILRNLTPGYSGEFEYIPLGGQDAFLGHVLAWTPEGDHIAFFGRYRKRRALVLVNVLTSKIDRRIEVPLDQASFPHFGTGGRYLYFTALLDGVGDIYRLDLETEELVNMTQDEFYDKFPVVSPDGRWLYYSRRVSGYDKIYRLSLDNADAEKEQITFGTFDDVGPTFSEDGKLLFYASNEDEEIFNLRSLDLETGDIVQYTDTLGGAFAPALVRNAESGDPQLIFTSYYKGDYGLYRLGLTEPYREIPGEEIVRTEGPVIDFVPPVLHQIIPENKRKKGTFEKLFVDSAPPIAVGVTSGGDFFGGSGISFSDVLGDQNFTFVALSVREFRTYAGSYTNLSGRLQYSVQGFDSTSFFFAFTPFFQSVFSREGALATIRQSGAQFVSIFPFDRFRRIELNGGIIRQRSGFEDACLDPEVAASVDPILFTQVCGFNPVTVADIISRRFPNGTVLPLGARYVSETTRFRNFGPLAGSTVMLGANISPGGTFLSRRTFEVDARKYFQLSSSALFALRFRGFHSTGDAPDLFWFGGNGDLRGYPFLSFVGNRAFFANAELRFPLIDAALTPIGFFGPLRGTFFVDVGGARFGDQAFKVFTDEPRISLVDGTIQTGFGLRDAVASYGFGLTFNVFGLPLHMDWSKLTDFAHVAEGTEFDFWVGFDF